MPPRSLFFFFSLSLSLLRLSLARSILVPYGTHKERGVGGGETHKKKRDTFHHVVRINQKSINECRGGGRMIMTMTKTTTLRLMILQIMILLLANNVVTSAFSSLTMLTFSSSSSPSSSSLFLSSSSSYFLPSSSSSSSSITTSRIRQQRQQEIMNRRRYLTKTTTTTTTTTKLRSMSSSSSSSSPPPYPQNNYTIIQKNSGTPPPSSPSSSSVSSSSSQLLRHHQLLPLPPNPRRDEDCIVYGPSTTTNTSTTTSTTTTSMEWKISNPYGWMRDDTRTKKEIFNYITIENEYTKNCIQMKQQQQNQQQQQQQQPQNQTNLQDVIRDELLNYICGGVDDDDVYNNNNNNNGTSTTKATTDDTNNKIEDNQDMKEEEEEEDIEMEKENLNNNNKEEEKAEHLVGRGNGNNNDNNIMDENYYWIYSTRTIPGKAFPIHYRRRVQRQQPKQQQPNSSPSSSQRQLPQEDTKKEEEEMMILDENILAEFLQCTTTTNNTTTNNNNNNNNNSNNNKYFTIHSMVPNPSSHTYIAISVDQVGDETYQLYILNLKNWNHHVVSSDTTNTSLVFYQFLEHNLILIESQMTGTIIWGNDDDDSNNNDENDTDDSILTLYYLQQDPFTQRPYQLYQWSRKNNNNTMTSTKMTTATTTTTTEQPTTTTTTTTKLVLLYEEKDPTYYCELSKSMDGQYLFLSLLSSNTTEIWFLDLRMITTKTSMSSSQHQQQHQQHQRQVLQQDGGGRTTTTTTTTTDPSLSLLQCITRRRPGVRYTVEHRYGTWWLTSNLMEEHWNDVDNTSTPPSSNTDTSSSFTENLRIWTAPAKAECQDEWKLVVLYRPTTTHKSTTQHQHDNEDEDDGGSSYISDKNNNNNITTTTSTPHRMMLLPSWFNGGILDPSIDNLVVFSSHVVIQGRHNGLPRIWILSVIDNNNNNNNGTLTGPTTTTVEDNDDNDNAITTTVIHKMEQLEFDEPAHYICLESTTTTSHSNNNNHYETSFHSETIIASYQSLITPPQRIEIKLSNPTQRNIISEQLIPGYDKTLYGCHQVHVPSRDGKVLIPVSLVYRKQDLLLTTTTTTTEEEEEEEHQAVVCDAPPPLEGGGRSPQPRQPLPLHLFGYGSYGHSLEAAFSPLRLVLLSRGMICAIAHVRGGGELGRSWYTNGSGQKKQNSINDFVDVARWLINNHWTTSQQLACEGRSAGGLLIGASINQAPELFQVAVLGVPFLDISLSMTDPTLPLTTIEGDEWGDIHCMMKYDPILNIPSFQEEQEQHQGKKKYPSCLLIGGFRDPRAPYWDSLKFAATLRYALYHRPATDSPAEKSSSTPAVVPDETVVCVKIDTSAGHSWGSDRYKYCDEMAFIYTFLLQELGL